MNQLTTQTMANMDIEKAMDLCEKLAKWLDRSPMFKSLGGAANIFSILMMAKELNIGPMRALTGGVYLVQGRPTLSAGLMAELILREGHYFEVLERSDKICKIKGYRKGREDKAQEISYAMQDAVRAGLTGKDNWKKHPAEMLYARCLSTLARIMFQDVIGGAYVHGEIVESVSFEAAEPLELEEFEQQQSQIEMQPESSEEQKAFIKKHKLDSSIDGFNQDLYDYVNIVGDKLNKSFLETIDAVIHDESNFLKAFEKYQEKQKKLANV